MNYYNPYLTMYPYMNTVARPGLFSRLISGMRGINFSSILTGTGKALNVVNQTIPLVKQVSPVVKNAKTMFKVMNEFKRVDTPTKKEEIKEDLNNYVKNTKLNEGPTFFL